MVFIIVSFYMNSESCFLTPLDDKAGGNQVLSKKGIKSVICYLPPTDDIQLGLIQWASLTLCSIYVFQFAWNFFTPGFHNPVPLFIDSTFSHCPWNVNVYQSSYPLHSFLLTVFLVGVYPPLWFDLNIHVSQIYSLNLHTVPRVQVNITNFTWGKFSKCLDWVVQIIPSLLPLPFPNSQSSNLSCSYSSSNFNQK